MMEKENFDCQTNKADLENFSTVKEETCDNKIKDACKNNRVNPNGETDNYDFMKSEILDEIKNCTATFKSQQIGDPDLTTDDKKRIAENILHKNPGAFLAKFGEFLKEDHLIYFLEKFSDSYEVQYYVKNLRNLLSDHKKNIIKRNRRYEAMKKMEAEGIYFSEEEMEKREPLLYHQMVGQFLSEKEKLEKNREAQKDVIPTFSSFLMYKMQREEINKLVETQQQEEKKEKLDSSSEEEINHSYQEKRWGEDWEEKNSRKKIQKKKQKENISLSKKEKTLLLQEFQSIMKTNFLNGKDIDFNYSEVDLNPEYDSMDLRTQDEEDKYFDEETNDATVCTDTGIDDY